ncbi:MAG TPA: PDZ domain-containing protein [Gaiellaceae bacterium]|nr:PDZ domain-containing protein [Gaiellaceae bacterium]
MKRFAGAAVVLGVLGLVTAFVLWWLPADDYLFVPDRAKPLADKVDIESERSAAKGDVYYVDLFVRRIRLLEQLLPFTRPEGSTFVSEEVLAPSGETDAERDRQNAADMLRSEETAAVVALRELGYDVVATPRGVLVTSVAPDVPAAEVLEPEDVVVAVDGIPVKTPADLRARISTREPGDTLTLAVQRQGKKPIEVKVRTIASPEDPSRAIVGILIEQEADVKLPIEVDIDLGRVGGPSAGLPFALEIARQLGRNVTNGCRIAATGALALDGTVIPVGGVEQKTVGARRADVDYFLVPAGENAEDAQEHANGLEVIPVESFQQALRKLATDVEKC